MSKNNGNAITRGLSGLYFGLSAAFAISALIHAAPAMLAGTVVWGLFGLAMRYCR